MKKRVLLVVSGAVLAVAACGRHDTTNTVANSDPSTDTNMAMDNTTAATPALTAQGFVNAAAASDRFEIETSKLASTAASSAAVKKFAAQMISAHTQSTAKLKSTLAGMSPAMTPDDTLTPDQQMTLDKLKGLKGTSFDSAYASAQVDAHQKTLDALNNYAASGDNAQLKTFATNLVPTVTAHLNMAKGLS
jgi:putative membrane protein